MVTFRNNNNNLRRNNFRRNDRNFKSNVDRSKFASNYSNNENFKRKGPGRNNHNASKLIEKYNDLAREASSNGDKILSENYLQYADHFMRILNEQDNLRKAKINEDKVVEVRSQFTPPTDAKSVEPETKSDKTEDIKEIKNEDKVLKEVN